MSDIIRTDKLNETLAAWWYMPEGMTNTCTGGVDMASLTQSHDYGELKFTPTNEMQVREWFAVHLKEFGYNILVSRSAYPDYVLEDRDGRQYRVEVESQSVHFLAHGHNPNGCDFVLCWTHNTKLSLPVLELSTRLWYQPMEINERAYEKSGHEQRNPAEVAKRLRAKVEKSAGEEYRRFIECYADNLQAKSQYISILEKPALALLSATRKLTQALSIEEMHPDDLFRLLNTEL